jgi:hypothetical protein
MAPMQITHSELSDAVIIDRQVLGTAQRPVRREQYLHRISSHATLLIVEWYPAQDGTHRKQMRFMPWPGL